MKSLSEQPHPPADDFSDFWSPITVKELRQGLRQPFFVWLFLLLHVLMIGALAVEWYFIQGPGSIAGHGMSKDFSSMVGSRTFWIVSYLVIGCLMPLRAFDTIASELDRGNHELLTLSGFTRWDVVRGKCMVQIIITLLTLASLLPSLICRYFFGGFRFMENILELLGLLFYTFATSSIIVGGSGFKSIGKRIAFISVGLLYTSYMAVMMIVTSAVASESGTGLPLYVCLLAVLASGVLQFSLGMLALQVGRSHLKLFLRPWDTPPKVTMTVLFILTPWILIFVSALTVGIGGIALLIGLLILGFRYDKDQEPKPINAQRG